MEKNKTKQKKLKRPLKRPWQDFVKSIVFLGKKTLLWYLVIFINFRTHTFLSLCLSQGHWHTQYFSTLVLLFFSRHCRWWNTGSLQANAGQPHFKPLTISISPATRERRPDQEWTATAKARSGPSSSLFTSFLCIQHERWTKTQLYYILKIGWMFLLANNKILIQRV